MPCVVHDTLKAIYPPVASTAGGLSDDRVRGGISEGALSETAGFTCRFPCLNSRFSQGLITSETSFSYSMAPVMTGVGLLPHAPVRGGVQRIPICASTWSNKAVIQSMVVMSSSVPGRVPRCRPAWRKEGYDHDDKAGKYHCVWGFVSDEHLWLRTRGMKIFSLDESPDRRNPCSLRRCARSLLSVWSWWARPC